MTDNNDDRFTLRPVNAAAESPVGADAFRAMMAGLGPFERHPRLAVGTSGGADSMALALLADEWARAEGGSVDALIVDHGLRPESAIEAVSVKKRLEAKGIAAHILKWQGAKPETGVQAAARRARYRLLCGFARERGILHLMLGHHRDDQAETFLMRLDAKSGVDGLAGMARLSERDGVRILRPFLHLPKVQLIATVTARKTPWIEDPSNRNRAYRRVRVRDHLEQEGVHASGLSAGRLAGLARQIGALRVEREEKAWRLLARAVDLDAAGFAWIDAGELANADRPLALRALAATIHCVGGRDFAPRSDRTETLLGRMLSLHPAAGGYTLGRCGVFAAPASAPNRYLICRETRGLPDPVAAIPGGVVDWDGRFHIRFAAEAGGTRVGPFWVAPLGRDGWREMVAADPTVRTGEAAARIQPRARVALPALYDADGLVEAPHFGYRRVNHTPGGDGKTGLPVVRIDKILFRPRRALSGAGFCLA